ncbi:hypothetical protein V1478_004318 [Vespula squamosa]|uniref:Integrase zinc-binding domain-containing protein n=1 Tax=Vespula squamosa TaxID=30214 RepID=A0ABD2BHM9_VESSQ
MHKAQAYFTIAYFTIVSGIPLDIGTKELADNGKQQAISEATFGRIKVTKKNKRYYIALSVKERLSVSTQLEILDEALHSLLDAALELQLETIAISRGPVGGVPWVNIKFKLRSIFSGSQIKILILKNEIIIPKEIERIQIVHENHTISISGHKGVTKTYARIKQKYFWPKIKTDVQNYIQNCRSCQTKKLVRLKPHQPTTITHTPSEAFDKISLDIVSPLPTIAIENSSILTIQDL